MRKVTRNVSVTVFLILLLLPHAQAEATGGSATSVTATESSIEGRARAVVIDADLSAQTVSMNLTAANVDGTVEVTRNEVVVDGLAIDPETHAHDPVHVVGVHATTFDAPEGARILIVPAKAALTLNGNLSGQLAPHGGGDLAFSSYANSTRPATILPTQGTIALTGTRGLLTVTGDFELVIWGANVTFQTTTGVTFVQTGLTREQVAPRPSGVNRGIERTTAREAHLSVLNGSVHFAVTTASSVYASSARLAGLADNSVFTLSDANGTFTLAGQDVAVRAQDLQVLGKLNVALERRLDGALAAQLSGHPQAVYVGGVAVDVAQTGTSPAWAVLVAVPLAVVLLVVFARRRRGRRLVARLDGLMHQGHFPDAVGVARRLQRYRRFAEDGVVAEAVALVKLGRHEAARAVLQGRPIKGRRVAGRNFVRARLAAMDGHAEEALQFLTNCLTESPAYSADAHADPVLGPLVTELEKRASRNVGGYA